MPHMMPRSRQRITAPSDEVQKSSTLDAGNLASDHYKSRMSPMRFKIRSLVLPYIIKESEYLGEFQRKIRTPGLDLYFAWSANLASHTFYVLMLPMPIWLGGDMIRDLVYVLGLGIFLSGFLKDFMCLPRPRSPPLHRITMSSYTTQEYGFPSSHSANAIAVTIILLWRLIDSRGQMSFSLLVSSVVFLTLYCFSLIFGRVYCGMHGTLDILVGSLIGIFLSLFRVFLGEKWDTWLLESHNDSILGIILTPILIVGGYVLLIHFHSEPADDCPCFDDSVAFIGVLIGVELTSWTICLEEFFPVPKESGHVPMHLVFDPLKVGFIVNILRLVLGIFLVGTWKTISKPLVFTILPPIYKFVGIYLPRRNYSATAFSEDSIKKIRSQSISNVSKDELANFNKLIKGVTDHAKKDSLGPETEIDYYALLESKDDAGGKLKKVSQVFRSRYDVEIIGRLIVYGGIPFVAFYGFAYFTKVLNLN